MTLEERRRLLASTGPNVVQSDTESAQPDKRSDALKVMENIATGGYSAVNSVLMGLPDFLIETAGGSKAKKVIDELRARNQEAAMVGDIGGTVGSMFIPGGAIVKGLGLGAKGLGAVKAGEGLVKAADWMKGGELTGNLLQKGGQAALRGGAQAAEQALPRALFASDTRDAEGNLSAETFGKSLGENLSTVPGSIATGAALGGVLGPAAQRLFGKGTKAMGQYGEDLATFGKNEAQELLDKATLATTGLETRALKRAAAALGMDTPQAATRRGGDYVSELAEGIRKLGIKGKRQWEALIDKNDQAWKAIDKGFEKNAPEGWNKILASKLAGDDDLIEQAMMKGEDSAMKMVDDAAKLVSGSTSIKSIRDTLSNIARNNMNGTPAERAKAQIAFAAKKKIDDFIADTSGEDVGEAKEMYKLLQPFMVQESRDVFKLGKAFSAGSPTFEKGAIAKAMGMGGGGAATGALLSGEVQNIGQENFDPTKLATASLMGSLAPKMLAKASNKVVDELGRKAGGLLAKPEVTEALVQSVKEAPQTISKAASILEQKQALNTNPDASIEQKEVTMAPEKVQAARAEFSNKFAGTMNAKLQQMYLKYYKDMDPQDFLDRVSAQTEGFTNMRAMAPILYPDEKGRNEFLRKYDAYLQLKNVDIDEAIKGTGFLGEFTPKGKKAIAEQQKLKDSLVNLASEGDPAKRAAAKKQVDAYIADVQKNPELVGQFMTDFGLDFNDLSKLGLTEGA